MTRTISALVLAVATTALAPPALGQSGLPEAIVTSQGPLSGDQREQLKAFIAKYSADLGKDGKDTQAIQKARTELLIPLQDPSVSVSFRSAYAAELKPIIDPLVGNASDVVAVNALRIAGKLAHKDAVAALEAGLKSPRTAVRYAAASGIGETFDAMLRTAPAMDAGSAKDLITRRLGPAMTAETDAGVFDAGVRALMSAGALDRQGWGSLRDEAMSVLAPMVSDRIQKLGKKPAEDAMMQAIIRAVGSARDTLANAGGGSRLGPGAQKDAAAMAGDALAYVQGLVQGQNFPVIVAADADNVQAEKKAARTAPANLASVAIATIFFANDGLGGRPLSANQLEMAQLLRSATGPDDARFLVGVRDLIGALSKPPFDFPPNRFAK